MERLQKILARGGIASRRHAESLIQEGRVRVNGRVVTELGAKADPHKDRVEVDGKRVVAEQLVYVALHKPRGVVSTLSDPEGRPTVKELLGSIPGRVFPIGRLDFATSGLLLATNDGAFADGLMHPRKAVPKSYVVKVQGVMQEGDVEVWEKGVMLEDGKTLPARAQLLRHEAGKTWFELTIREGRNQQIRRMGEATGFPVMRLARVRFAGVELEGLAPGRVRYLTRDELIALKKTYGVPKSVPATPEEPVRARSARGPAAKKGAAGRAARSFGAPAGERASAGERAPAGERGGAQRGGAQRGGVRKGAPRAAGAQDERKPRTEPGRYGGGSPGRRSYEVREDWGGGAARGSSRGRYGDDASRDDQRPHADLGGGRGGRTRTTGTAGGIGARGEAERVKGRRGGR